MVNKVDSAWRSWGSILGFVRGLRLAELILNPRAFLGFTSLSRQNLRH